MDYCADCVGDCQYCEDYEPIPDACTYCGTEHGVEVEYCNSGEHCEMCCPNFPSCTDDCDTTKCSSCDSYCHNCGECFDGEEVDYCESEEHCYYCCDCEENSD